MLTSLPLKGGGIFFISWLSWACYSEECEIAGCDMQEDRIRKLGC